MTSTPKQQDEAASVLSTISSQQDKNIRSSRVVFLVIVVLLSLAFLLIVLVAAFLALWTPYMTSSGALFTSRGLITPSVFSDHVGGLEVLVTSSLTGNLERKCSFLSGSIAEKKGRRFEALRKELELACRHAEENWPQLRNSTLRVNWKMVKKAVVTGGIPDRISATFNRSRTQVSDGYSREGVRDFVAELERVNRTLWRNLSVEGLFAAEEADKLWDTMAHFISPSDLARVPNGAKFLLTAPVKYDGGSVMVFLPMEKEGGRSYELLENSGSSGGCFSSAKYVMLDRKAARCAKLEKADLTKRCVWMSEGKRGSVSVTCPSRVLESASFVECKVRETKDLMEQIREAARKKGKSGRKEEGGNFRLSCK